MPLARRYGAAVVVLALDDGGIPPTAGGRLEVVERVRDAARAAGLDDTDLVVDCLVMTAATDPNAARTTLDALSAVHERGLATVLGVSNVSHGLPGRPQLNATMLALAVDAGRQFKALLGQALARDRTTSVRRPWLLMPRR